ncbi:tetratricopeptide repeat protein [Halocynthiibacter styelae]|uniref:Sel1 repeat family protein n=1 Tax=Halocynthiibacter styelae TaxID=2761955 RepID=A0A8J7J3D6_9RHOB|nr:tetratricopeptide repeat protein [Paenihalocynthiibacter styelae]MBI1492450.1 sel1 repeat family protein [Paenihalocynthiibacter styelae]
MDEKRVPSWAGDEDENDIFMKVIQQMAMRDGVPQAYIQNLLQGGDTFQNLVYFAGAMEHHGSSFTEQQAAVSEEIVKLWKLAPDDAMAGGPQDGFTTSEADEVVIGLEKLRSLALQGDSSAQLKLAIIYAEGNGVIRDDTEALRLFRLAADKGSAAAQSYLGMFYSEGDRVTKDDAEGVRWFRLAAIQGASDAQSALSAMYFAGRGVPRDRITALMWMNIAEINGNETVATHRDSLEQPMTPEEISEASRRAKLCLASGYTDYTQDDTQEGSVQDNFISTQTHGAASEQEIPQPSAVQGDNAAQRLINSVKQKTDMIADRYPPSHDGHPDTNEIIINDAMRALSEMKELFKEADEAKTLCNQISELEPVSTKPMIELFISQVEDNFQAVMLNSLQVQTKIIDAINRMVLLNSNVPDGEGKEAVKDLVANLTVSANKMGELHTEMADGMENVVVPAMRRAKVSDRMNGT